MKILNLFVLFFFFTVSAFAQTRGLIECQDKLGVPAWEKPRSIVQVKQFSCGDSVEVLSADQDYVKIRIGDGAATAFVESRFVRIQEVGSNLPSAGREGATPRAELPAPSRAPVASSERTKPQSTKKGNPVHGLELGIEVSPQKYQQYLNYAEILKEEIMEQSGVQFGVYGDYAFHPRKFTLEMEGRFSFANTDYFHPDLTYPDYVKDIREYTIETRLLFGRNISLSERLYLTPVTGIGYRYLYDGMGGKRNRWGDYFWDRKSHFLYSPIGVGVTVGLGHGWSLNPSAEYDHFWRGWMHSEYGDANPELPTLMTVQNNGWGGRGALRISKKFGGKEILIEPVFRYWDIKESEIGSFSYGGYITEGQEPANKSSEWGIRLGVKF